MSQRWFYDDNGKCLGSYEGPDDDIPEWLIGAHEGPEPSDARQVLDLETGELGPIPLDEVKVSLKASVDAAAERERLRYITPGAGQAMTYQQKADEASRFLAADQPVEADYPMLMAEKGITGATMADVANVIIQAFQQWQVIGGAIEAARLGTKAAIDAATTVADARAAADAVSWPAA